MNLAGLASCLELPDDYQFVFPNAPFPHFQVPEGRAWYALETEQFLGLQDSRQALQEWLKTLADGTGFPPSQTILGGFSQGGAMTLDVGRSMGFAGLMSLSGYLHFDPGLNEESKVTSPVLIVHGNQDRVVPLTAGWQARDYFQKNHAQVQYHELEMGHEIPPDVWRIIREFVLETL